MPTCVSLAFLTLQQPFNNEKTDNRQKISKFCKKTFYSFLQDYNYLSFSNYSQSHNINFRNPHFTVPKPNKPSLISHNHKHS